jgi:hypothetical protein
VSPKKFGEVGKSGRPARTEEGAASELASPGLGGGDMLDGFGVCGRLNVKEGVGVLIIVGENRFCGGASTKG